MAVARTSSMQLIQAPGEVSNCNKANRLTYSFNSVSPNTNVPVSTFNRSLSRSLKRRLLMPCDFGRSLSCSGFFDTCRHCGNQIFRKAQSRPRICLQCEKKRATPIHDRCKDCQEPIIRSNVRKARICQKCKKSREKPHPASQSFAANAGISLHSNWHSPFPSNPLFRPSCLPMYSVTSQSNARRLSAINHWFQVMSHQLMQCHQQRMAVSQMEVSSTLPATSPQSQPSLSHPNSPLCPTLYAPFEALTESSFLTDVAMLPFHGTVASDSTRQAPHRLPKINTEHFETPEDLVAYLRDRALQKLSRYFPSTPSGCKSHSDGFHSPSTTTSQTKYGTSYAPILVPQVNPFQIHQGVADLHITPNRLTDGIIAEIDASTFVVSDTTPAKKDNANDAECAVDEEKPVSCVSCCQNKNCPTSWPLNSESFAQNKRSKLTHDELKHPSVANDSERQAVATLHTPHKNAFWTSSLEQPVLPLGAQELPQSVVHNKDLLTDTEPLDALRGAGGYDASNHQETTIYRSQPSSTSQPALHQSSQRLNTLKALLHPGDFSPESLLTLNEHKHQQGHHELSSESPMGHSLKRKKRAVHQRLEHLMSCANLDSTGAPTCATVTSRTQRQCPPAEMSVSF